MSAKKDYLQILIFQILTIPVVSAFFIFIKPSKVAALYAGTLFLVFGTFALVKVQRQPNSKRGILLWLLYVHLFLISIPLISVRLLNWGTAFEDLLIFGLPAPIFHRASSYVYMTILAFVAYNFWRVRKDSVSDSGRPSR